jgi:hypothetical protein
MTKEELIQVAQRCWATWNQTPLDVKASYEAWWAIVGDLDAEAVNAAINRLSVSSTFCPKPGELRRFVLGEDVPSPAEAWSAYCEVRDCMSKGTPVPALHPLVSKCIRVSGHTLITNSDRDHFLSLYEGMLAQYRQENYAP